MYIYGLFLPQITTVVACNMVAFYPLIISIKYKTWLHYPEGKDNSAATKANWNRLNGATHWTETEY